MSESPTPSKKRKVRTQDKPDEVAELAVVKPGKKKLKKSARKEAAADEQLEKTAEKAEQCREYLEKWTESVKPQSDSSVWKFNKQIQNWLIRNLFARKVISKDIFKLALPYVGSIKGASAARLLEQAKKIADVDQEEHDEQLRRLQKKEGAESKARDIKITRKRAIAITKVLS